MIVKRSLSFDPQVPQGWSSWAPGTSPVHGLINWYTESSLLFVVDVAHRDRQRDSSLISVGGIIFIAPPRGVGVIQTEPLGGPKSGILYQGAISPYGGVWQCLETSLSQAGGCCWRLVGRDGCCQLSAMPRMATTAQNEWSGVAIVPGLGRPALDHEVGQRC